MTCRLTFTLVFALAGCDASLGGGGGVQDAATALDARRLDSGVVGPDAPPDARTCANGAMLAPDGSCLKFNATAVTYAAAKVSCGQMNAGGHLAYLKSQQLHDAALLLVGTTDTWIGGNDIATENAFVWDDGTAFNFTNWSTGEPNNASGAGYQEDCVILAGARVEKKWDDRPCDASEVATSGTFAYLCQY